MRLLIAATIVLMTVTASTVATAQNKGPTFQMTPQKDMSSAIQDLSRKLGKGDARILNGVAVVDLCNKTPANWGVTIVAAGVKFFYSDGTDYIDGPRNINLGAGGCANFQSNDNLKCVKQFLLAATVDVPNEGPANMTYQDGVGQGECLLHDGVDLGPKNVMSEQDRKGAQGNSSLLELKSSRSK